MEFDAEAFEKKLATLKDTQDGIQQMSSWCLQRRNHHKKIVSSWLNVLKQVRVEHRLILFYLANDVIQNSKRKHYEFVDSWVTALQKATTMVRDEKVRGKIYRIFNIWLQRDIYSEEYLSDLKGLLDIKKQNINNQNNANHSHNNNQNRFQPKLVSSSSVPQSNNENNNCSNYKSDANSEFQCSILIKKINDCVRNGADTDKTFKKLPRTNKSYLDSIKSNMIKDKSHSEDIEKDIEQYVTALEVYIKSLKTEIKSRNSLIRNIEDAKEFYGNQREEVKVVVNAYKNFGLRIKSVKKKLDEVTPNLPSPIPSPDINAPSPEPDDVDIALPDDDSSLNVNLLSSAGTSNYVSYMDGNLPFDINDFKSESSLNKLQKQHGVRQARINVQAIEVISTRKEELQRMNYDINTFNSPISKLYSNDYNQTVNNFPVSVPFCLSIGTQQSSPITSKKTLVPPPPIPPMLSDQSLDFTIDWNSAWNPGNNSFSNIIDTPISPPNFEKEGNNLRVVEYDEELNDLDLFSNDLENRNLPVLQKDKNRLIDVDHRNLISLTGSPGLTNSKAEEFANSFLNEPDDLFQQKDVDYRTQGFNSSMVCSEANVIPLKPPSSLIEIEQSCAENEISIAQSTSIERSFITKNELTGNINRDNTESVDMDVSDDDIESYLKESENKIIQNNLLEAHDSNEEQTDFQLQFNNDFDSQDVVNQLEENDINSVWDNNWPQAQINSSIRMNHPHPSHMSFKHRFNSPRFRGTATVGLRPQSFQNKFHNIPGNTIKPHRGGSSFYFNRPGNSQRGSPMQQRGGTTGFQRGNFRGRLW